MARKCFFSFHYKPDCTRASQVRNAGMVEGNVPVRDNDWETVTNGGEKAIEKWIDDQLDGRTCTVVLIGENTAGRKWINHEIRRSWQLGKGVVGIYIHNLKDPWTQQQSSKGKNPFAEFTFENLSFADVVKAYDPPFTVSANVYAHIRDNIAALLASKNAQKSVWVPWELGWADGELGPDKIAVLPISESRYSIDGIEFLGLYQRVEIADGGVLGVFPAGLNQGKTLADWLSGK